MTDVTYPDVVGCYSAAATPHFELRLAASPLVHAFFRAVDQFVRETGADSEDSYWSTVGRQLKRARFEIASHPIPASQVLGKLDGVSERLARVAATNPELAAVADHLNESIRLILESVENPLLAEIQRILGEASAGALCLSEPRLVRPTERLLAAAGLDLEVITPTQLRGATTHAWIATVGPMRWYPAFVFAAPRAHTVLNVSYSWLSSRPTRLAAFNRRGLISRFSDAVQLAHTSSSPEAELLVDSILPESGLARSKAFLSRLAGDNTHELAAALQVLVEGDAVVLLDAEEGASTIVIDLAELGKRRVHRAVVRDLEPGTFLLVREGGGGDYILPIADQLLGERSVVCRTRQRLWKAKLRERIRQSTYATVVRELAQAGAPRANEGNLRRWVWERSIKPNDYADFFAIMSIIGMRAEAESYWKSMSLIDRAHMRAGQVVRKRLLEKVHQTDLGKLEKLGRASFSLGHASGNLLACRIREVGRVPVQVPLSRVGHVIDTASMEWLD